MSEALLQARNICVHYGQTRALDQVSLEIAAGETLALVGPSGSGKSTLARALLRLQPLRSGTITFDGMDWLALKGAALRRERAKMQMVFQDPLSAFNPRSHVRDLLEAPLRIHRRKQDIGALLQEVGLDPALASRRVFEISGGQRQRVAIARALATQPSLIVLDEAVSSLDVTVRARILDLLRDLQRRNNTAYLFITHDLAVASQLAGRIAVMEGGRIVECQTAAALIASPQAAITKALIAAIPNPASFPRQDMSRLRTP
ncbi:peptide ABC transporter ATP-binding protein [Falsochrobactrum shanghaiense]|uniref:Peptide ABC transporter ATP-binding protein n=1 Tax=Falsochrobactrum shanghaiense TaxID=2201899 RepID=A0A316JCM5_9HYPH|nr:dipeptide/oligopeptide/nickel ABC transporter ATP-binding protein [Falsochrobactrum shanghaiense]PWL18435.1 peptide ABC transporter ATP-binding protein [Falsochrobactrum shanghaiense]